MIDHALAWKALSVLFHMEEWTLWTITHQIFEGCCLSWHISHRFGPSILGSQPIGYSIKENVTVNVTLGRIKKRCLAYSDRNGRSIPFQRYIISDGLHLIEIDDNIPDRFGILSSIKFYTSLERYGSPLSIGIGKMSFFDPTKRHVFSDIFLYT